MAGFGNKPARRNHRRTYHNATPTIPLEASNPTPLQQQGRQRPCYSHFLNRLTAPEVGEVVRFDLGLGSLHAQNVAVSPRCPWISVPIDFVFSVT